ncbi:cupredoxin domain-containing protein [Geodermatophilus sp. URMC 64]
MSPAQVRRRSATLILGLALGLLTACGGSDDDAGSADTTTAAGTTSSSAAESSAGGSSTSAAASEITATEADFSIALDSGTDLTAGDYTINVTNTGQATHNLVVEQDGSEVAKSDTLQPGSAGTVEVTLEPGTYVFYCGIGNHRAMGMEVEVTVS